MKLFISLSLLYCVRVFAETGGVPSPTPEATFFGEPVLIAPSTTEPSMMGQTDSLDSIEPVETSYVLQVEGERYNCHCRATYESAAKQSLVVGACLLNGLNPPDNKNPCGAIASKLGGTWAQIKRSNEELTGDCYGLYGGSPSSTQLLQGSWRCVERRPQ